MNLSRELLFLVAIKYKMTSVILKDLYASKTLTSSIQQDFNYHLERGNLLEALAKVRSRSDLVKVIQRGLTKSYIAQQAKLGNGKSLLYDILEHAGKVWLANYLSSLDQDTIANLIRERYISSSMILSYQLPAHDFNDPWYVIASLRQQPFDPTISFYMFLVNYGLACDVETVSDYVKLVGPEYFLLDDVKQVSQLFIQKFGAQDSISILLKDAITPKHRIVMKHGRIYQFINQVGGTYTFGSDITYQGPMRQAFRTTEGDLLIGTNYGSFINGYLLQDIYEGTLIEANQEYNYLTTDDGFVYFEESIPEIMSKGRGYPIQGLDLYLLVSDMKLQGLDNTIGIPEDLLQVVNRVANYSIWKDRIVINYSDGTSYNSRDGIHTFRYMPDVTLGSNDKELVYIYEIGFDFYLNFEHYNLKTKEVYEVVIEGITITFDRFGYNTEN